MSLISTGSISLDSTFKYMFLTKLQTRFDKSCLGKQGQSKFFGQNQMFPQKITLSIMDEI
jgi:hypothetical protein